ncbi:MAG: hypothetical protein LBV42_00075 [Methanobrevibacter sp.]|jgi:hypothetical protein|nr:hypothetical protein [Methanobrevibacter sp.]
MKKGTKLINNIYLHFDKNLKPIELEILDLLKVFDVGKSSLKKIINMKENIIISKDNNCYL